MNDLIKRSDAIKALHEEWDGGWLEVTGEWIADNCEAVLNKLPSADRPQGDWIGGTVEHGPGYTCSICHYRVPPWKNTPYCPHCGAEMKGADYE